MLASVCCTLLKIFGWKTELSIIQPKKYILIGAPHTSNWDFPLTLLALSCMGIKFNWVAKHTLFNWPFGFLFRAIGGIAVDRSAGASFLMRTIELYENRSNLILAIAPEGTRGKTTHWKTGFYSIAERAKVPIALGFIDYPGRIIGITKIFNPSGDINKDFTIIRDFYSDKRGKFITKQGEIRIKQRKRDKP